MLTWILKARPRLGLLCKSLAEYSSRHRERIEAIFQVLREAEGDCRVAVAPRNNGRKTTSLRAKRSNLTTPAPSSANDPGAVPDQSAATSEIMLICAVFYDQRKRARYSNGTHRLNG